MPTFPQRLPSVNGDDGQWGDILNLYLKKEHYDDGNPAGSPGNGGHQKITILAGTATAGTAPLKFTTGILLATPEAGAVEWSNTTDKLYFTQTAGPNTRLTIAAYNDASGANGDTYYRDSSGNFLRLPIGGTNKVLTVISGVPSWQDIPAPVVSTQRTFGFFAG